MQTHALEKPLASEKTAAQIERRRNRDEKKKEKQKSICLVFLFASWTRSATQKKSNIGAVLIPPDCHILRLSNFMPIVYYPLPYARSLHVDCSYFRFTVCSSSFTDGIFAKAVNAIAARRTMYRKETKERKK